MGNCIKRHKKHKTLLKTVQSGWGETKAGEMQVRLVGRGTCIQESTCMHGEVNPRPYWSPRSKQQMHGQQLNFFLPFWRRHKLPSSSCPHVLFCIPKWWSWCRIQMDVDRSTLLINYTVIKLCYKRHANQSCNRLISLLSTGYAVGTEQRSRFFILDNKWAGRGWTR